MILAPMAGVTDTAFRHVCIEYGCERAFCEMVSVNALSYESKRTHCLMDRADNEKRLNIQIFGGDPELMGAQAMKIADDIGDDLEYLDINMGCPMPKITKCGYGSALLKDPERAAAIVKSVAKAGVPTSVKMRIGYKGRDIAPVDFARRMVDAGAQLIAVHGRTADQLYSGNADWEAVKLVVDGVGVPVIGNGDVTSSTKAKEMQEYAGCADVLIARGAMGNPFIFAGKDDATPVERVEAAAHHLSLSTHYKDEKTAILQMRKHIAWYIKDQRGSCAVRAAINASRTQKEICDILEEYREKLV